MALQTSSTPPSGDQIPPPPTSAGGRALPTAPQPLAAKRLDAMLQVGAARSFGGLSPVALALAATDWGLHVATQPAQTAQLMLEGWQMAVEALTAATRGTVPPGDARFAAPPWQAFPYPWLAQGQRVLEQWWSRASERRGMQTHHREMMRFFSSRWLDAMSPSSQPLLNPEVLARTQAERGDNLLAGALNAQDQWRERQGLVPLQAPQTRWQPGHEVAITPGKVVHRNALIELIQYLPATARVQSKPLLIVPSWIMKYYILDLAPAHSMVRWLVEQGHTVFMVSWRNPDADDAGLSMDDYVELGIFDSLAAIRRQVPEASVHACGYCLGGTLLAAAAAALQSSPQPELPPLSSLSLLAAETDFTEPGELGVLIDEEQVTLLENLMAEQGYLSGEQMAGTFTFLHARELYWDYRLRAYWLGESEHPTDLMAWNADLTRMPATMHSEYLRRCYLGNDLAEGRFPVMGKPVSLRDLRQPLFVVGTEKDHVSPWRSVFKIHHLIGGDVTFVLTSGGHNAGIISEPGHPKRRHAVQKHRAGDSVPDPEGWARTAEHRDGSWWPTWHAWLLTQSDGYTVKARTPLRESVLCEAPGTYVLERAP